jgi:hypothetical protein
MDKPSLCAIYQPNFFPRLSALAKLYVAGTCVILDDVQFAARLPAPARLNEEARVNELRTRTLPARLMVYFTLTLWLDFGKGYVRVLTSLLSGQRWLAAAGADTPCPRTGRSPWPVGAWATSH